MTAPTSEAPQTGITRLLEAHLVTQDPGASATFHRAAFGFTVVPDSGAGQLLAVPGSTGGRLRLLPSQEEGPSATQDQPADHPALWDPGTRLLGIYSRDLTDTVARAAAAGARCRRPVTYAYGAAAMSELVLQGPDGVWWTVPAVPQTPMTPQPSPALDADSERLHSELHSAVLVVSDHDAAVRFFVEGGGMSVVFDAPMAGADFEDLVGMPEGAVLRLAFLVGPDRAPGRIEVMSFEGVEQIDRSVESRGVTALVLGVRDLPGTMRALLAAGGERVSDTVLRGPGGLTVELVEDGGTALEDSARQSAANH
ncbi:VOC family protein [Ornithinimicrobium faecis]|uniref:VOC family protein n=1 Tax=Ornithinimicrobium faecis TaxID=2934158 RepID=UPI002117567C|nr:VOC family protein [Ornithinimicrobium sp. HY1745]